METPDIIIEPTPSWKFVDYKKIWHFRELLYTFAWRDIKVKYKQTLLGLGWVVLQPIITTVIFTILFGNLAKMPSGKLPYSLFVLSGLVCWTFFSNILTNGANSMINNETILKKTYFPKIILPLSAILTNSLDFAINFIILLIFASFLGFIPSPLIFLALPVALLIISITALGISAFLSALNVKYRDVRHILPFFIQILLFLTPVIYSANILSPQKQLLLALNPLTLAIELLRSSFSNENFLNPEMVVISVLSAIFLLLIGLWYFRKTERFFADIV